MIPEEEELIRQYVDAFNRHDIEAVMASFPPELSHHSFDASDCFEGLSKVIGLSVT